MAVRDAADYGSDEPGPIASEADELTHAELLCLYQDAEQNIRFAKLLQWRATGGTLAVLVILALLAPLYGRTADMTRILTILTYAVGAASLYALAILQSWQGTEREKIELIAGRLSSLAREVFSLKSALSADVERYTLLGFMCAAILAGGFLTLCRLMRWFPG